MPSSLVNKMRKKGSWCSGRIPAPKIANNQRAPGSACKVCDRKPLSRVVRVHPFSPCNPGRTKEGEPPVGVLQSHRLDQPVRQIAGTHAFLPGVEVVVNGGHVDVIERVGLWEALLFLQIPGRGTDPDRVVHFGEGLVFRPRSLRSDGDNEEEQKSYCKRSADNELPAHQRALRLRISKPGSGQDVLDDVPVVDVQSLAARHLQPPRVEP